MAHVAFGYLDHDGDLNMYDADIFSGSDYRPDGVEGQLRGANKIIYYENLGNNTLADSITVRNVGRRSHSNN